LTDRPHFSESGILWRRWNAATAREIADRGRPLLLFVADPLHPLWLFLRAIFAAMPANARLRALLDGEFLGLYLEASEIPEEIGVFGAGSRYHIAILSPHGFNALVTFDPVAGDPARLVGEIVLVLERLLETYGTPADPPRAKSKLSRWLRFLARGAPPQLDPPRPRR
jgi:hypothetical protein